MTVAIENVDKPHITWAAAQLGVTTTPIKARSGKHSTVYRLSGGDSSWFLKIGDDLQSECERTRWLEDKLPVPQVVAFNDGLDRDAMLMTAIPGTDMGRLSETMSPDQAISWLAPAYKSFHQVDTRNCPFAAYKTGSTLVHGDASLLNVLFTEDGQLSGFVDLFDMGVGDVEVDLSATVWSLWRNYGPGHGLKFLKAYGLTDATEADVERLWHMYATSPIFDR